MINQEELLNCLVTLRTNKTKQINRLKDFLNEDTLREMNSQNFIACIIHDYINHHSYNYITHYK